MGYQEERERRIFIFEDTIKYCEREREILEMIQNTRERTILYTALPMKNEKIVNDGHSLCKTVISEEGVLDTTQKLCKEFPEFRVGVINFASPVNPGGKVIKGGTSQEECLCRCTTLYPCLDIDFLCQRYYSFGNKRNAPIYTDTCIYTPSVVQVKTDQEWPEILRENERNVFDVISCSIPDTKQERPKTMISLEEDTVGNMEWNRILVRKIHKVLQIAVIHKIEIIVLGPFRYDILFHLLWEEELKKVLKKFEHCFHCISIIVEFS